MRINPGKVARYFGGPLDGQTIEKPSLRGRWPIYRDDDGTKISVQQGDKEWIGWRRTPTRYYARQIVWEIQADGERSLPRVVYVHATAWQDWHELRAKANKTGQERTGQGK